jgi:signal transduction histidine kinase/ActR/RegA family two-component response regulator
MDGRGILTDAPEPTADWLQTYISPHDQETVMAAVRRAVETKSVFESEHRVTRADGSSGWVAARAVPILDANGQVVEWFGTAKDVTEYRQALDALSHTQRLEVVGRLAGAIAHDFNNQLMVLVSNIELAQLSTRDKTAQRYMASAIRASEVAQGLVRRLAAWSRTREVRARSLNLNEVVEDLSEVLNGLLEERVTLKRKLGAELWMVGADPADLDGALLNLVLNARDALPDGGQITLETSNETVRAGTDASVRQAAGDYVCLSITDTGTGMSEDVRRQVFTPFFTTKEQGTGLGLFSVRSMVEEAGGFLQLESAPGIGTTVRLYLPRDGQGQTIDRREPSPQEATTLPDPARTVLLVEDQEAVRRSAKNLLAAIGYRVIEAKEASEALALLGARDDIELVFSDISMPGSLSGLDLARKIRAHWPGVGVLLTTGFNSEIDPGSGTHRETGVAVLPKPYRLNALRQALEQAMETVNSSG